MKLLFLLSLLTIAQCIQISPPKSAFLARNSNDKFKTPPDLQHAETEAIPVETDSKPVIADETDDKTVETDDKTVETDAKPLVADETDAEPVKTGETAPKTVETNSKPVIADETVPKTVKTVETAPKTVETDTKTVETDAKHAENDETDAETAETNSHPTVAPPTYHFVDVSGLGKARGVKLKSVNGSEFFSYMSLPYAEPPVRFMNPVEWSGPWVNEEGTDYYDASYLRDRCPQGSLILSGIAAGKEDCLHLSVYTPIAPEDVEGDGLPVMVFIHGGAYMTGDAFLYVPTKLMDRDVIVVVVQYRLGLFGFLAGEIEEAPGNMGLMDQVMALRWIQKHIDEFGGNVDLVTVFGQSAGGASSSWMHLTPLSHADVPQNNGRQLLHRVIPQSGSALEQWTIDNDPTSAFERTALHLNCWYDGWEHIDAVDCMKELSFEKIVNASGALYLEDRLAGGLGFRGLSPVIQENMDHLDVELVIPKDPREIISNGEFLHIPVMSGSVRDEGTLVLGLSYKDYMVPLNISIYDEEFLKYEVLPLILGAFGIDDKTGSISSTMELQYLSDAEMGDWYSMQGGLVDMCGVMFLKSGLWELMNEVYLKDPVSNPLFFYSWEYEADDSLFGWIFLSVPDIPVEGGISHADDLIYLFHLPGDLDQRQLQMVDKMTLMWTNFATYGNPTPNTTESGWSDMEGVERWEPYTADKPYFMLIKDEFQSHIDFPTRWTYHSGSTEFTEIPPTVDTSDLERQIEEVEKERDSFRIATGVLGGVLGIVLVAGVLGACMKNSKKKNQIV